MNWRVIGAALFALGVSACFSPTFPEGLDCSPEGNCPGDLQCVASQCISPQGNSDCPSGMQEILYSGAATTFTPPACVRSIVIEAYGGQGGGGREGGGGGQGAVMEGRFAIVESPLFNVLVGGEGEDAELGVTNPLEQGGGSGGGGTFITNAQGQPLVIAGGGGGATHTGVVNSKTNMLDIVTLVPGGHGQAGEAGEAGDGANPGLRGEAGFGGHTHASDEEFHEGTGGGGFVGAGVGPSTGNTTLFGLANKPGQSFGMGGAGGVAGTGGFPAGRNGAFGGGGSAGFTGGGGGGYSGGGSGSGATESDRGSGGGGSFNGGTDQINVGGESPMGNAGPGKVIFSW